VVASVAVAPRETEHAEYAEHGTNSTVNLNQLVVAPPRAQAGRRLVVPPARPATARPLASSARMRGLYWSRSRTTGTGGREQARCSLEDLRRLQSEHQAGRIGHARVRTRSWLRVTGVEPIEPVAGPEPPALLGTRRCGARRDEKRLSRLAVTLTQRTLSPSGRDTVLAVTNATRYRWQRRLGPGLREKRSPPTRPRFLVNKCPPGVLVTGGSEHQCRIRVASRRWPSDG
jgi:hypothetical protein